MKPFSIALLFLSIAVTHTVLGQSYTPKIEPSACPIKVESSFKTRCGYLVVPENRNKTNGKIVKLPFIIAYSKNPDKKKDPLLFTTGGPGGGSLGWIMGATAHSPILSRDCIAFEQRGTGYSLPNLSGTALSEAIKESYRKNLNLDSMTLVGVRRFKNELEAKGIDLSGYNTDETVADIQDLLTVLGIDSVNLTGGSYSGGLMLAVLQKDPRRIRSLILDSPLPTFIPIDEDEPANFNESLNIVFARVDKDSTDTLRYGHLKERFQQYFTAIGMHPFSISYLEKGTTDSIRVQYTRADLLDIIEGILFDPSRLKDIAYVITEMIDGHHAVYMKNRLDGIFNNEQGPNGMRLSVYCADQTAYHSEAVLHSLYKAYPYMEGYHINDVYREMCDCWQVPPIRKETKQPFYSPVPVLLADGEMDNACRPLYIDMIHHYMPNSQRLLFTQRSHMTGGRYMDHLVSLFLDNPYRKLVSEDKEIVAY